MVFRDSHPAAAGWGEARPGRAYFCLPAFADLGFEQLLRAHAICPSRMCVLQHLSDIALGIGIPAANARPAAKELDAQSDQTDHTVFPEVLGISLIKRCAR